VVDLIIVKNAKKIKETPAKCTLCEGNHPANYKGCEHCHNLIKGNNKFRNDIKRTTPVNNNIYKYIYKIYNIYKIMLAYDNKEVKQM
jgi:hypothetical protein